MQESLDVRVCKRSLFFILDQLSHNKNRKKHVNESNKSLNLSVLKQYIHSVDDQRAGEDRTEV